MDRTCYLWFVDPKKRARANTAVSLLCTMGKVVNLKYQGPNPILRVPLQVAWWHDLPLYHWLPRLPAPLRQRLAVDVCEHILLREKHEDLQSLTMVFPNFLCKRTLRVKSFWVPVANIFQDCREALKQHRSKGWCPYTRLSLLQREDHKPTCFFSHHFSDKPDCTKKRLAKIERSEKTESDAAVFCCVFHSAQLALESVALLRTNLSFLRSQCTAIPTHERSPARWWQSAIIMREKWQSMAELTRVCWKKYTIDQHRMIYTYKLSLS